MIFCPNHGRGPRCWFLSLRCFWTPLVKMSYNTLYTLHKTKYIWCFVINQTKINCCWGDVLSFSLVTRSVWHTIAPRKGVRPPHNPERQTPFFFETKITRLIDGWRKSGSKVQARLHHHHHCHHQAAAASSAAASGSIDWDLPNWRCTRQRKFSVYIITVIFTAQSICWKRGETRTTSLQMPPPASVLNQLSRRRGGIKFFRLWDHHNTFKAWHCKIANIEYNFDDLDLFFLCNTFSNLFKLLWQHSASK